MNELDCLRILVGGLIGTSSFGQVTFAYPAFGGGTGGGSSATVTPNFFAPTASSSTVIPAGAINASVLILTGTGTLNGVDQPVGVPWTEPNKLAASVTLVLGSPGTARVYYGT